MAKLQILVEKKDAVLVFERGSGIEALFNPDKLVFNKTVSWKSQNASQRDVPELQFTNAKPRTLKLDLIFDTYDTGEAQKVDVRTHTKKLLQLCTVENHGDKHRPPVCRLSWGSVGIFFQGVLERLEQQFTLFMEDGTPVRATSQCTFKEWRTNYEDLNRQAQESSDVVKMRTLKRGETLSSIAAEEYRNPKLWRAIADENSIDDPLGLVPGTVLLIPKLDRQNHSNGGYGA
ncbi:MAG: LysM peptidoglycan-binding domain-containing protein [Desulfobacteraceae bacterium]|nr:LysM peptidoglycan-binding domain-containing protein [Desulfobacteraceae bacterium]